MNGHYGQRHSHVEDFNHVRLAKPHPGEDQKDGQTSLRGLNMDANGRVASAFGN